MKLAEEAKLTEPLPVPKSTVLVLQVVFWITLTLVLIVLVSVLFWRILVGLPQVAQASQLPLSEAVFWTVAKILNSSIIIIGYFVILFISDVFIKYQTLL
jgi:flagellar biosynthesis protein FlhB